MDIRLNDILVMKKAHPCGEKRWLVLRTGADFRLRCLGCGHELMTPRFKAEKNIGRIHDESNDSVAEASKTREKVKLHVSYASGLAGGALQFGVFFVAAALALSGRGGGKPEFVQGSLQADRTAIEASFAG